MRIGVIGASGKIGAMRIQTIQENPKTSLAAVMDVTEDLALKNANGAPHFTDVDAMLETPMDAVVVSTPPAIREGICLKAFDKGLHVLVEKPLSNTAEAGKRIIDAAKAKGLIIAGGFNMRYYPAFAYVRDVLDSGALGTIDHVRVFGGHNGLSNFQTEWQYKAPASGGGAMWDVGIHMTDMATFVMGEITSVYGTATNTVWGVDGSEDNSMAVFRNADGLAASYHATWNEWKGYLSAIEVYGDKGMVRGQYAPMQNVLITMTSPGNNAKTVKKRYLDIAIREKLKSWTTTAVASFADELGDFIAHVEGKSDLRIADGHDALRSIEVAEAARKSQETGEVVHLERRGPFRG